MSQIHLNTETFKNDHLLDSFSDLLRSVSAMNLQAPSRGVSLFGWFTFQRNCWRVKKKASSLLGNLKETNRAWTNLGSSFSDKETPLKTRSSEMKRILDSVYVQQEGAIGEVQELIDHVAGIKNANRHLKKTESIFRESLEVLIQMVESIKKVNLELCKEVSENEIDAGLFPLAQS